MIIIINNSYDIRSYQWYNSFKNFISYSIFSFHHTIMNILIFFEIKSTMITIFKSTWTYYSFIFCNINILTLRTWWYSCRRIIYYFITIAINTIMIYFITHRTYISLTFSTLNHYNIYDFCLFRITILSITNKIY